ncbi:E3 ubiquitin-protein ligase TRIM9 isoform X3 [Drosophila ficusphila]|uniref:E3 ubiquitin-protein ligase TRIM9 isoform X3 n=1 Tax=Drosophila ficusphila TaxID=30025 RepID=UPI0007E80D18|nr:E3 ubiquitin-protein ligase TRIM9 isoform X3 [Drosophila ficusphila]
MEDELRCPTCKQLYANPVLLPCFHALCLGCALDIQTPYNPGSGLPVNGSGGSATSGHNGMHNNGGSSGAGATTSGSNPGGPGTRHSSHSSAASTASSNTGSESVTSDQDQSDKVSIFSEADSGVVCCSNTSRPVSYAGTGLLPGVVAPPGAAYCLTCPLCRKLVFFDDGGVRNLPTYRAMEAIVDRFCAREALRCQMCETDPKVASLVCEQCEIRYCDACRELCHPARGPLAKHTLVKPRGAAQQRESVCGEHEETLSQYCLNCKAPACSSCIGEQRHQTHDVQSINVTCKAQKVCYATLGWIDFNLCHEDLAYLSGLLGLFPWDTLTHNTHLQCQYLHTLRTQQQHKQKQERNTTEIDKQNKNETTGNDVTWSTPNGSNSDLSHTYVLNVHPPSVLASC